jgi:hypothetical protein
LWTWETLAGSSLLLRPTDVLKDDPEFVEGLDNNLTSGAALSYLVTPNNASADEFYANMIRIPHYRTNRWFNLMDKENVVQILAEHRD